MEKGRRSDGIEGVWEPNARKGLAEGESKVSDGSDGMSFDRLWDLQIASGVCIAIRDRNFAVINLPGEIAQIRSPEKRREGEEEEDDGFHGIDFEGHITRALLRG